MLILNSRYRGIVVVEILILHSGYRGIVAIQGNYPQKCCHSALLSCVSSFIRSSRRRTLLVDDISTPQLFAHYMNVGADLAYLTPELWLLHVLHKQNTLVGFAGLCKYFQS